MIKKCLFILILSLNSINIIAQETISKYNLYVNLGSGILYNKFFSSDYFANKYILLPGYVGELQVNKNGQNWGFRFGAEINYFHYKYDYSKPTVGENVPPNSGSFGHYNNKVYRLSIPLLANFKHGKWQTSVGLNVEVLQFGKYNVTTGSSWGYQSLGTGTYANGFKFQVPFLNTTSFPDWFRLRTGIMYEFTKRFNVQADAIIHPFSIYEFYLKFGIRLK